MTILLKEGKLCQFRDSNNYTMNLGLATNSWGDLIYLILPIVCRDFRTTFKVNMSPAKKFCWRMRASIPLPRACKARALPFELIPRRLFAPVGIRYFTFSSILKLLLVYCQRYDYIVEKRKLFQFRESNNY